jgi:hypothetical protein
MIGLPSVTARFTWESWYTQFYISIFMTLRTLRWICTSSHFGSGYCFCLKIRTPIQQPQSVIWPSLLHYLFIILTRRSVVSGNGNSYITEYARRLHRNKVMTVSAWSCCRKKVIYLTHTSARE